MALRAADSPVFDGFENRLDAYPYEAHKMLPGWWIVSDVMHGVFPLPPGYFMELQLQALLEDECKTKEI